MFGIWKLGEHCIDGGKEIGGETCKEKHLTDLCVFVQPSPLCPQVEAQMEQLLKRETREIEVYKRELMAWFKEQKKEQDQSRVLEEHTAKEKFKVRTNKKQPQIAHYLETAHSLCGPLWRVHLREPAGSPSCATYRRRAAWTGSRVTRLTFA